MVCMNSGDGRSVREDGRDGERIGVDGPDRAPGRFPHHRGGARSGAFAPRQA